MYVLNELENKRFGPSGGGRLFYIPMNDLGAPAAVIKRLTLFQN